LELTGLRLEAQQHLRKLTESAFYFVHVRLCGFKTSNRSYVINAAKAAKVDGLEQRIVYISVRLVSFIINICILYERPRVWELTQTHHFCTQSLLIFLPQFKSSSKFLPHRSKGLTEEALANLKYSDTIIFRPAFLKGAQRPDMRLAETMVG
jgi:hypothetical protein